METQILAYIYLFIALSISFCFSIILFTNPIYSIISLILFFLCNAFLFLFLGAEFISFSYILVYVGAILILFLWIIMTVPIKNSPYTFSNKFVLLYSIFIFVGFIIFLYIAPVQLKVIKILPDNILFSSFIKFLRFNLDFDFNLIYTKEAVDIMSNLGLFDIFNKQTGLTDPKEAYKYNSFFSPIFKDCFLHNIFTIYISQKLCLTFPLSLENSSFFYKSIFDFFVKENVFPTNIFDLNVYLSAVSSINLNSSNVFFYKSWKQVNFFFLIFYPTENLSVEIMRSVHDSVYTAIACDRLGINVDDLQFTYNYLNNDIFFNYMHYTNDFYSKPFSRLGFTLYSKYCFHLIIVSTILTASLVGSVSLLRFNVDFIYQNNTNNEHT